MCPHPESIQGQFHPAPQCSPTLGQLGHRELHFETHFSDNMETKPQSIEYTGRWCLPRVRRTVQCSAVNQEGEAGGVTHLEAQLCPLTRPPIWLHRTITYAHVVQSIYYMSQYFNPNMYYPLSAMRAMRKIKSPPSCFPRIKNRIRTLDVKRPNCVFQSRP